MRPGAVPLLLVVLSACFITEDEFNRVVQERDLLGARVSEVEDELDLAKARIVELQKQLAVAQTVKPTGPSDAQINAAYSELKLSREGKLKAKIETSMGPIVCELHPKVAPTTVLNFVGLAEGTKEWVDPKSGERTTQKLYDGTLFHRVVDGFMIQGGDPAGTGRGTIGYTFGDEIWPSERFDRAGILAMANSGPNTNGSQFFITAAPEPQLNDKHTIFGLCDTETVQRILKVPTNGPDRRPAKDVVITSVTIERQQTP